MRLRLWAGSASSRPHSLVLISARGAGWQAFPDQLAAGEQWRPRRVGESGGVDDRGRGCRGAGCAVGGVAGAALILGVGLKHRGRFCRDGRRRRGARATGAGQRLLVHAPRTGFDFTRDQRFTLPAGTRGGTAQALVPTRRPPSSSSRSTGCSAPSPTSATSYTNAAEQKVTRRSAIWSISSASSARGSTSTCSTWRRSGYERQLDRADEGRTGAEGRHRRGPGEQHLLRRQQARAAAIVQRVPAARQDREQGGQRRSRQPRARCRRASTGSPAACSRSRSADRRSRCAWSTNCSPRRTGGTAASLHPRRAAKALTDQGFDVVDIVLKKNWNDHSTRPGAGRGHAARRASWSDSKATRTRPARTLRREGRRADSRRGEEGRGGSAKAAVARLREFYTQLGEGTRQREWTELIAAFRKWNGTTGRAISEENESEFRNMLLAV